MQTQEKISYEPRHKKTYLQFPTRSDTNQAVHPQKTGKGLKSRKTRDCNICVAKTKALISYAVTASADPAFFFACATIRFSNDLAYGGILVI